METFWPTVGMVEPAVGGVGPCARKMDLIVSRSVCEEGLSARRWGRWRWWRVLFCRRCRGRGDCGVSREGVGRGGGRDVQDGVFFFAGGIHVEAFREVVHCRGGWSRE